MGLNIYQFDSIDEVNHFLNGGLTGKKFPVEGIRGLVGKTINFTNPLGSVTFTTGTNGPDPDTLVWKDVKDQIEAQVSGVKVVLLNGGVVGFIMATPTTAPALAATSQVAKTLLGFPISGAVTGKVVLPSTNVGTPRLDHVAGGPETQFILYVLE